MIIHQKNAICSLFAPNEHHELSTPNETNAQDNKTPSRLGFTSTDFPTPASTPLLSTKEIFKQYIYTYMERLKISPNH